MAPITRESLRQRYADLSDAALLQRLVSSDLTDLAREVGQEELAERGLSLPIPQPAALPAAPPQETLPAAQLHAPLAAAGPETELAPDHFNQNPYQAPRGSVTATPEPPKSPARRPLLHWLWWAYTAYIGIKIVMGALNWVAHSWYLPIGLGLGLNAWALTGLIAWRLRRPLLTSWLWVVCLALTLAQLAIGVRAAWSLLDVYTPAPGQVVLTVGAWMMGLPLLWGLACYALLSPSIWRRGQS